MTAVSDFNLIERIVAALNRPAGTTSDHDLNQGVNLAPDRKLRPAAVMVPLIGASGEISVILTKRSSALKHHPGQIAFPGGKQDECDRNLYSTALREAEEEIGLKPENVRLIGQMAAHETVTGFYVTPVVAYVHSNFHAVPEPGEVDEVFQVPLTHLLDTERFSIQSRRWRGAARRYYTVPFGPYYIWGATARMLRALAESVRAE